VPFSHTIIALDSLKKGMNKLLVNEVNIKADLEKNWAVVAEAIQTILRREGYPNPYEALKELTRTNSVIDAKSIASFIDNLDVDERLKSELKEISPSNYTGIPTQY
jgi:adenylosuccinate lyase